MIANIPKVQLEKRCLCTFCYILNGRILDIINCLILSKFSIFFLWFRESLPENNGLFFVRPPNNGSSNRRKPPFTDFFCLFCSIDTIRITSDNVRKQVPCIPRKSCKDYPAMNERFGEYVRQNLFFHLKWAPLKWLPVADNWRVGFLLYGVLFSINWIQSRLTKRRKLTSICLPEFYQVIDPGCNK